MITAKEKKCLEIIGDNMDMIIKFHKTRTLRTTIQFRKVLADAYFELNGNEIDKAKINNGSCGSCVTRAFNTIYSIYDRQRNSSRSNDREVGQVKSEGMAKKPKRGRGRPRKKK